MTQVIKLGIKRPVTKPLLPDPAPRQVKYTLISADDHLMEPPHTFEGRLPAKLQARAPRVVETEEGHQVWSIEDRPYFQVGFMCVAGRAREDQRMEPARFEEIRPGYARMRMTVRADMVNGHDLAHGGLIFTLVDVTERERSRLALERSMEDLERLNASLDRLVEERTEQLRDAMSELEAFYGAGDPARTHAAGAAGGDAVQASQRDRPQVHDGSNGIAISPGRSASGHALLWINPHTSFYFRAEAQATSDEGLNVYGAITWGQFFVYQGFNDRAGWMHTSSSVDNIDEYRETIVSKGEGFAYKYSSEERPVTASADVK